MAHFLTGDDKYRDLIYDDDYRSYLVNRVDSPGYRFGRTNGKRVRGRAHPRREQLGRVDAQGGQAQRSQHLAGEREQPQPRWPGEEEAGKGERGDHDRGHGDDLAPVRPAQGMGAASGGTAILSQRP